MSELPTGTVTFLFTDLEGSTRLWEEHPEAMKSALARHDSILQESVDAHGGVVFSRMGDGLAAAFHDYLRSLPAHPSTPRPVTLNVWEAVYFDHDIDRLRMLADIAASIGVERYVLDDGWFHGRRDDNAGLGDWWVYEGVFPNGLHPIVDHVRGLGMEFGLWFEPEMVNPDSDLARAHPEWLLATPGRLPRPSRPSSTRSAQAILHKSASMRPMPWPRLVTH